MPWTSFLMMVVSFQSLGSRRRLHAITCVIKLYSALFVLYELYMACETGVGRVLGTLPVTDGCHLFQVGVTATALSWAY